MPQKKSSHRAKNLGPFAVKKYRQTDEERERWKRAQERRRQADREISESLDESATVSEIGSMEEEPIILPHRTRSGQLLDLRDMAPNPLTARVRALNPTPSSNDDLPDLDESHSLASAELEELTGGYDINQPMSSVDPGTEHSTRLPWRPYREPPSGKKPPRAGRPRWRSFSTIIDGQQGTYRLGDEYRHRAFGSYGDVRKTVAWFEGSIEVQVALKTLRHFIVEDPSRPEMSRTAEKIKKRLRKEVKIWMALRHPNIAPLLGYREDIELCMISPWYENGNIKEYLQRTSPGTQEKLLLVSQIASGVNYLHTSSPVLVHGDLKPDNVMIDKHGVAHLIDFGLSKAIEEESSDTAKSSSSRHVGNAFWTATELLLDRDGTRSPSSDVYSYACVVLFIMTGKLPFGTGNEKETLIIIARMEGAQPIEPNSSCPEFEQLPGLLTILRACWARSPGERPTMHEIINAIVNL